MEISDSDPMPVVMTLDKRLKFIADTKMVLKLPVGEVSREEKCGWSWDGASIPKMFWYFIGHPLDTEFRHASYWHDRFCENSKTYIDRCLADLIFLYLLLKAKVPIVKCLLMWLACRAYALFLWKPQRIKESSKGVQEL